MTDPERLTMARHMVADFRTTNADQAALLSPAGWPVTRAALADQLDARLAGHGAPAQAMTSYCGCAAFLYCLLRDRPDLYVRYALSLWLGEPFSLRSGSVHIDIAVHDGTRRSLAAIHRSGRRDAIGDLDWMTMASLSGATRLIAPMGPAATAPTDRGAAITWPWMVKRWFAAVGSAPRVDSVGIGLFARSTRDLLDLLALWGTHWLVMQIDSSLLGGGAKSIQQRHWVVVSPHHQPLADGLVTNLRLVSWGDEHYPIPDPTPGHVASRFYGGYAFAPIG